MRAVAAAALDSCSSLVSEHCSLRDVWKNYNESHVLHRTVDHADHYQLHMPPRHGTGHVRLMEIGVQSGGSARTWKQWYGERLYYVGVDIEPQCMRSQSSDESIFVEIGSQTNETFLMDVCKRHGPFDVIIDDGAHRPEMIIASLRALWPHTECMNNKSLYAIEDMQTMVMPKYTANPRDMYDIVGEAFWSMHHHWAYISPYSGSMAKYGVGLTQHPVFRDLVSAVYAYDSIAFFQRSRKPKPRELQLGRDGFGYGMGHPTKQSQSQKLLKGAKSHVLGGPIGSTAEPT